MGRQEYTTFIESNKINDTFQLVTDLSFSKKLEILKELKKEYTPSIINMALNSYRLDYINLNRIDLRMVLQKLKFYCKKVNKHE